VWARPVRPIPRIPADVAQEVETRTEPSHPGTGEPRSVLETVRQTLDDLMAEDERVVVLGEDVGIMGGVFRATEGLHERHGGARVIDTPLAESAIVGIGVGMALAGLRPVVEIQFADFLHSCVDQLVNEAAKIHYRSNGDFCVPMVVRAPWGGGTHRAIYHSQAVEAMYAHVAGIKVVCPSTVADAAGLLREAVDDPDPVLFLEHKLTYRRVKGLMPDGDWRVPIGVAAVARPGDDMTLVTYGRHRHLSVEAAEALAADGYSVEVIDLRTISPLDRDTILSSVARTGRLLVVHEDNISFGVGAEVAAIVAEEAFYDLDAPVRRLAMPDVPAMPYNTVQEAALLIGADEIAAAARVLLDE
jgi:2-oxoisovalerate dehydrogenase E1 component beta subunit